MSELLTVSKNKIFYVTRVILWLLILREQPGTRGGKIGQCMLTSCTYCNISTCSPSLSFDIHFHRGEQWTAHTGSHRSGHLHRHKWEWKQRKIMEQEQKISFVNQRRSQIPRQRLGILEMWPTVMMPSVQQVAGWLLSSGCRTRLQCHLGSPSHAFWPCDLWSHTRYRYYSRHFQKYSPQWPPTKAKMILLC